MIIHLKQIHEFDRFHKNRSAVVILYERYNKS